MELYGVSIGESTPWPEVVEKVAERVASRKISEGILFCWTGTGVSIATNKLPGIRAALRPDVATARGARQWNHANVLVMGLRPTSELLAGESWMLGSLLPSAEARMPRMCLGLPS